MNLKSIIYTFQFKLRQAILGHYYATARSDVPDIGNGFVPKRIVFILAGLIGDSIMSYPAIMAARREWPNSHIAVIGKTHNRELFSACSEFDQFHVCDEDPFSIRGRLKVKALQKWIRSQNFDTAIILLGDQYAHLLAKANIPIRVGVKETPLESCLTHLYGIGSPRTWGTNERLNSIRLFRSCIEKLIPKLSIDQAVATEAREKLCEFGLDKKEKYVALHPFGSSPRQRWNLKNIIPLAESIYKSHGIRTVLIGGKETFSELDLGSRIVDTRGRLSLQELLTVISDSEFIITTDSGPFHIAGALEKPIIGLFRDRRPEHANAYPTGKVVFGYDSRCANECEWDKCAEADCRQMAAINMNEILKEIQKSSKLDR